MTNRIVQKIKDKIEYEKESYRMSQEELKRVMLDRPELFDKKGK